MLFLILCFVVIFTKPVYPQSSQEIPTITWNDTKIPSWSEITFASLPPITQSGSLTVSDDVIAQLGYDPSRSWSAGQTADQYMMLGDFQDSLQIQNFTLSQISQISGLDLAQISLDSFKLIKFQTLGSLIKAIPEIKELSIAQVKPIKDLLNKQLSTNIDSNLKIGQIFKQSPILKSDNSKSLQKEDINSIIKINQQLEQSPMLKDLEFKSLQMSQYSIDSIAGLASVPLSSFQNWQGTTISDIPGLNNITFDQFSINLVGSTTAIADIAFETSEQKISRTVSGSYQEGFAVGCDTNCAHVELSGDSNILGKAWVSGKYQLIKGGEGSLSSVNGGKEPTGRNPFGDAFKVVVWDTSEKDGTFSQALFFRSCSRTNFVDLGCTPYFIGPIPFLNYKEKESIFLGDETSTISRVNKSSNLLNISKTDCSNKYNPSNINVNALALAFSSVQGSYDFVGNYLCDSQRNCGRPLGIMQLMSYNRDVRKIISNKPGGSEFLSKLDAGEQVTREEMLEFFPLSEQQLLLQSKFNKLLDIAKQKEDPYTGNKITSKRLVKHASQMYFAGSAIPVDAEIINPIDNKSVKSYGDKIATKYSQIINSMNCF